MKISEIRRQTADLVISRSFRDDVIEKCRLVSARTRLVTANSSRKRSLRLLLQSSTILGSPSIRKVSGSPPADFAVSVANRYDGTRSQAWRGRAMLERVPGRALRSFPFHRSSMPPDRNLESFARSIRRSRARSKRFGMTSRENRLLRARLLEFHMLGRSKRKH